MIKKMVNKQTNPSLIPPMTLVDMAWQGYLKKVSLFTSVVLIPTLFYLLIDSMQYIALHATAQNVLTGFSRVVANNGIVMLLLELLAVLLQIIATGALLSVVTDKNIDSPSKAYTKALTYFFPLLFIALLSSLITGGGFLLLIIPGLILSIWFTFSQYLLFAENKRGLTALLTSREYVRGFFWQIVWRILFITLIVGALSTLGGFFFVLFKNEFLTQIGQNIISLVTVPLLLLYEYELFRNVKDIKSSPLTLPAKGGFIALGAFPVVVVVLLCIVSLPYLHTFHVKGDAMAPSYTTDERLLITDLPPQIFPIADRVVYQDKKSGALQIRNVMAGPGDEIMRKGEEIVVNEKNTTAIHHASYSDTFLTPKFPLADKKSMKIAADTYYVVAEKRIGPSATWEKIAADQIRGVPIVCYWNCSSKVK